MNNLASMKIVLGYARYLKLALWLIYCGYSKEPSERDGSFEPSKHRFSLINKKILAIICALYIHIFHGNP